ISPVGPPPAITTAGSVIAVLRPRSRRSRPTHHIPRPPRSPAAHTPTSACRVPVTVPRVPPPDRRPCATHTPATTHAFSDSYLRRYLASLGDSATRPGFYRKPPGALYIESREEWVPHRPTRHRTRFWPRQTPLRRRMHH